MKKQSAKRAVRRLLAVPHLNYGFYPTPIEELPRLRKALGGGPRLFIKRDDYTGPGLGGNKVRKLEYVLAQAVAEGAEVVITIGSLNSNHARITAAMCARSGLHCILVLNAAAPTESSDRFKPASLCLDEMFGAEIHLVSSRQERAPTMAAIAESLRGAGKRVAEIPLGASVPLGALGYVRAVQEAAAQLATMGARVDYIFHSSSSGGTMAGLVAGCQLFGLDHVQLIGISPDDPAPSISAEVGRIIRGVGELLGLPAGALRDEVTILDEYTGSGYGVPTPESEEAIKLLARAEGILLDPVYTAKAMAALIDWVRRGKLTERETVLFWHTGGQVAMFYTPQ